MSINTISLSTDNCSTIQSGPLLHILFRIDSDAGVGAVSALTVLALTLNGALVPAADRTVAVADR